MTGLGSPASAPLATPERPWLGLRAYTPTTAAYFYGREREIDDLFRRISLRPLTLLYGKSGLGKTSLLGAGLWPRLKVEGWHPLLLRLRFDADAPTLVEQVRAELAGVLGQPPVPLWQQAFDPKWREAVQLQRPVLIFDQFEELFTLVAPSTENDAGARRPDRRDEAAALMAELAALIDRRPPGNQPIPDGYDWRESAVRIVLTLREDYLHELERWKKLIPALMNNRVELRELRGPDALDAVTRPASKGAQALIDTEVAQCLVCFVAQRTPDTPLDEIDAVPPLLSLLCTELNEARLHSGAQQITQAQLQGQADQVLEHFYQRSFEGMPAGVPETVEALLIDSGSRIREACSRDTVLSAMRAHGVQTPEAHLDRLVNGRLLTIEERGGAPRVELTHDLLVPLVAQARERRQAKNEQRAAAQRRRRRVHIVIALLAGFFSTVSFAVFYARAVAWERTRQAEQAETEAAMAKVETREALMQLESITRAHDGLMRKQEALIAELNARDATYARAVSAEVLEIARDPRGLQALELYNQGQIGQARSVLTALVAAEQQAREIASKIQHAAHLRTIAELTENAIGRDGTTTDQAIADYEAVVASYAIAEDWYALAELYRQKGSLPQAERAARAMLAVAETDRDQALALILLGDVQQAQGDLTAALENYQRTIEIMERLTSADPNNAEAQRDLALSLDRLGDVQQVQGDLTAALANYRLSLDIREFQDIAAPRYAEEVQRDLASSLERLGDLQRMQGDLPAALENYQRRLEIMERLASAYPSSVGVQRDLASSLERLGDVRGAQGDLPAALVNYRDSLDIRELQASADPSNAEMQRDLALNLDRVGDVLRAQGDLTAALVYFRRSLVIRERLASADLSSLQAQRDLALSLDRVGDVQQVQGDLPAALANFRRGLAIHERLASADSSNAWAQRDLSVSLGRLGAVQQAQGDQREAVANFRPSLKIPERLASADPSSAEAQRDLWRSHIRLAQITFDQGDTQAVETHYRAAYTTLKAMAGRGMHLSPNDHDWLAWLRRQLNIP